MTQQSSDPPVELLLWDSQFFNFRVAHVTGTSLAPEQWEQILSWCQANDIRCLYYEADLSDFQSLSTASDAGFLAVDVRVVLERSITTATLQENISTLKDSQLIVRPAQPDELPALEEIAREIGEVSRFSLDPHFPRGASGEMYATWVRKINQSTHGVVLTSLFNDQAIGFIACEKQGNVGKIVLVGVRSAFRGHGMGIPLLRKALNWFSEQGCTVARVVTQGRNVTAQRMYQKAGFCTASVSLVYHRWFD